MKFLKLVLLFFYLFIFEDKSIGQNLVPNWSFEDYDTCPNFEDQIQFAIGWSKFSSAGTTPDYYNSCSSPNTFGVPYSLFTHQNAHRNCNAYAAIVTFWTPFLYREYIGIQLSQPLIIGQKYFISFYTVMSEYELSGIHYGMPSNNIGIRLSTVPFSSANPCPIDNFSHIHSLMIISDSLNWNRVAGSVIADSSYTYLIVGNFYDDQNTDTLQYSCGTCLNHGSYYLVDDICLSSDSLLCNGGSDELSCTTSSDESNIHSNNSMFPNPVLNYVHVDLKEDSYSFIQIFSMMGNIMYSNKIETQNLTIDLSGYASGTYILKAFSKNNELMMINKIIKL